MIKYSYGLTQFIFSLLVILASSLLLVNHFSWLGIIVAFIVYKIVNILGVGTGLHENYCHNNRKVTLLFYLSILSGIGSPVTFLKKHYLHHKYVDTILDPTSTKRTSVLKVVTGIWTIVPTIYNSSDDASILMMKGTWIDKYYYLILALLIFITFSISVNLCLYLVLLPMVFNNIDSNFLFNWYFHRKGKAVNSKILRYWYCHRYAGHHAVHHRMYKGL